MSSLLPSATSTTVPLSFSRNNLPSAGSTVYITEYASISTGSTLATFDADINSGNVRLLTTPTNAVTVVKVTRTGVKA